MEEKSLIVHLFRNYPTNTYTKNILQMRCKNKNFSSNSFFLDYRLLLLPTQMIILLKSNSNVNVKEKKIIFKKIVPSSYLIYLFSITSFIHFFKSFLTFSSSRSHKIEKIKNTMLSLINFRQHFFGSGFVLTS